MLTLFFCLLPIISRLPLPPSPLLFLFLILRLHHQVEQAYREDGMGA